ncbi:MAG TPA: branched-chain amino acid ABC transporter substrate-binding protein [Solirubrobacteraceae bacterium]|nr:branched-chain amino acid ABC transporter substrate-binding protein [Solirubrobacteraceae bacterium]
MLRARRHAISAALHAALLTACAGALLYGGGCGGVSGAAGGQSDQLTIYSSLPLQGPAGAISTQLIDGEKLALKDAGGHVGPFKIGYVSLDDSNPSSGEWEPGLTAANAKTAADEPSAIAFLGDYDSAATAISLPEINAAGILQLSPASPYGGLTSSLYAGQDEPQRFYLTGKRNFARLQPGDQRQARAQVELMRSLGIGKLYVLDDEDPFQLALAQMVTADAQAAGIEVPGHDSVDTARAGSYSGEAAKVAESGAQAVFFAGDGPGAATLLEQLGEASSGLRLLGSSSLAQRGFTAKLDAQTAARTLLSTPYLPVSLYPPAARRVAAAYRRQFGSRAEAYALFGYEAMSATLQAIRRAGSHGNDRQAVVDALFAQGEHDSVIGPYAIEADGETTLASYGVDRIVNGSPVFWRELNTG